MKIVVLLTAYNEEKNIKGVLEKITYPVILVDDGSTDKTSENSILVKHFAKNLLWGISLDMSAMKKLTQYGGVFLLFSIAIIFAWVLSHILNKEGNQR